MAGSKKSQASSGEARRRILDAAPTLFTDYARVGHTIDLSLPIPPTSRPPVALMYWGRQHAKSFLKKSNSSSCNCWIRCMRQEYRLPGTSYEYRSGLLSKADNC